MPTTTSTQPLPGAPLPTRWGMLAAIDLHGCDASRLADPGQHPPLRAGGDRRHRDARARPAPPRPLRHGRARGLVGDAVHRDELDHDPRRRGGARCFVDVFSCCAFDPDAAAAVATAHFGGTATVDRARADERARPRARRAGGSGRVADTVPYVLDTVRGSTRPHRGTWLIWGVLAIVVCVSQRADGASWSLVMVAAQAALTSLIFVLAVRRGDGGSEHARARDDRRRRRSG